MADIRFTGNAVAVCQVDTFTPANVETTDIFTLTVTGLDMTTFEVSFTAAAATVANVTAGLVAAWNASADALCTGITAADNTTAFTLTADTAGVAFSVAATTTDGGGTDNQTLSKAATTANAGPNDWSSLDNWSGGALPGGAGSQNVYIDSATILYGLDQSGIGNALASLNVNGSKIGTNPAGGYLPAYLQIKATAVNVGREVGPGTTTQTVPVLVDAGATASTITVYNSGTNSTRPAVWIKAANAATVVRVIKGKVGVGYGGGETTTIASVDVSYDKSVLGDSDVWIGAGVTLTTLTGDGGEIDLQCAATTATIENGVLTTGGSGAVATVNVNGGSAVLSSTGTITALNVRGDGFADCSKSSAARTITTAKIERGGNAKIKYDPGIVTMTNKIQPYDAAGMITLTAA